MQIIDFGLKPYREVWELQKTLQKKVIKDKLDHAQVREEYLLIGEHLPVYTLGFHGNENNLLFDEETLSRNNCECIRIERGGDITFHGPGQIILYPIIDLVKHNLGVKEYVGILEETVIRLLEERGIKGKRIEGATGVWIRKDKSDEKICAIGIKVSKGVTMHGLALNINTDLDQFNAINPCGFIDKGVTSLEKETGNLHNISEMKNRITEIFLSVLKN